MRITPVQTINNNISKPIPRTVAQKGVISPAFTGKDKFINPTFLSGAKNIIPKIAASLGGVAMIPRFFPDKEENPAERIALYLKLNGNAITPNVFNDFYNKSPELANALVQSGRRVSEYDIHTLSDISQFKLTEKQYSTLECLFSAQNITRKPVFDTNEIVSTYIDQLDEETCKSIINNKEKLEKIFSSIPQTLNKGKDYIDAALVLETIHDIDSDEFIMYFETLSEYNLSYMFSWFKCEPEIRQEVLKRINENTTLAKYADNYYLPIIPDKELLKKFDIILDYEKSGTPIDTFFKTPVSILDEAYNAENIKKGLLRLKSLPEEQFKNVKGTNLGDIIVLFETLKDIGNISHNVTLDDYYWLVDNLSLLDWRVHEKIVNSDYLFILQSFTEENKKLFSQNAALLNKITSKGISLSGRDVFNVLLNPEGVANLEKAEKILTDDFDYIMKELKYKCNNTNPVFVEIVKNFLSNKDNLPVFVSSPDISRETIIDNLFHISKIRPAIAKAPEKYLNDVKNRFSDLELCFLQKYLELGNTDKDSADAFFNSLSADTRDKFYIIVRNLDYNNNYYLGTLFNALAVTDSEYINMLLAKRLNKFRLGISDIESLPYQAKYFINKLIRHGKNRNSEGEIIKLSGKQKHLIVEYIPIMHKTIQSDLASLIDSCSEPTGHSGDFIFDLDRFLNVYSKIIFEKLGYDKDKYNKYSTSLMEWDRNNIHHLIKPNNRDKGELKLIFDLITEGRFKDYITNPETPHGRANKGTQRIFGMLGLDYNRWLSGIGMENINCAGKDYTIGLIDRGAKNMIFMGNYTSCCTALNECKGDSVPNYLLNTAFNVVGVKDSQGNIAATSRIFISTNFKNEPALIIDNIEISNKFRATLNKAESERFVQQVWSYIDKFAQSLSDNHIPVYMSHKYPKISIPERPVISLRIKLAGETTRPELYINTIGDYAITKDSYVCNLINVFNKD